MKKLMIFIFAAIMAISFVGTAAAQNTVELKNVINDANMRVLYPMVYSKMATGATAYLVTNDPYLGGTWSATGTTVFAISNERLNAGGTEMRAVQLTDLSNQDFFTAADSGVSPLGGPQLLSGTTTNMILYVVATSEVGSSGLGGATIYRIDGGTGTVELEVGIPYNGFLPGAAGSDLHAGGIYAQTLSGNTPWCTAPVTLDRDATDATSAVSVYGVSGTTTMSTGVSVWRRSSATLAAPGATGTTVFNQASGVSAVYGAPLVSGNSLFIIGNYKTAAGVSSGISIFQFDKRNLGAEPIGGMASVCGAGLNSANVIEPGDATLAAIPVAQITPTPCAQSEGTSGGTIYVVPWQGGVTLYDTQNLTQLFAYDFLNGDTSGVTASPVCTDTKLLISWASSVSCFETKNASASGVSLVWEYDFDEAAGVANNQYQIYNTPAISNNYAYITTTDTASANASTIYRFSLNDTFDGNPAIVSTEPALYSSPIVVGSNLWFCSYNPVVDRISEANYASGYDYWAQFKFNAAKTGENTFVEDEEDYQPGSSGGCFISTIK